VNSRAGVNVMWITAEFHSAICNRMPWNCPLSLLVDGTWTTWSNQSSSMRLHVMAKSNFLQLRRRFRNIRAHKSVSSLSRLVASIRDETRERASLQNVIPRFKSLPEILSRELKIAFPLCHNLCFVKFYNAR